MNKLARHDWERVNLVTPSGKQRHGRRCKNCKVLNYTFNGFHRWRYPDGRVHDERTVDETSCNG